MSRRDIRLITTIQGFNIIKETCESSKYIEFTNLIDDANISKVADIVYLCWNRLGNEKCEQ